MKIETIEQLAEKLAAGVECWRTVYGFVPVNNRVVAIRDHGDVQMVELQPAEGYKGDNFLVAFGNGWTAEFHCRDESPSATNMEWGTGLPERKGIIEYHGGPPEVRGRTQPILPWAHSTHPDRMALTLPQAFVDFCEERGLVPSEVVAGFIGDLCGIEQRGPFNSHGSDERRAAMEWFERVDWTYCAKTSKED